MAQVSAARLTGPKLDNRRVLAGIIDLLIVGAGALVVLYAGDALTGDRGGALAAVILGWALYYYFALESGAGQTVGKKLMNLRVVRADGAPAGMREIAVRTILRVVDGIGMYIVGLIVMLVTGERRQRIGDLAAATIVVDASGPATAVAEPAAPAEAEVEVDDEVGVHDEVEVEDVAGEEPAAEPLDEVAEPTHTITLPSRPTPPEPLSGESEPAADEVAEETEQVAGAEPVMDAEPILETEPAVEAESVVEDEPVDEYEPAEEVESFEAEPHEVKAYEVEPIDLESIVPVESTVQAEEPAAEEEPAVEVEDAPAAEVEEPAIEVQEPEAADTLPPAMSPSLEGLAADVAAAQEAPQETAQETAPDAAHGEPADDEPVNVKSVETVSAMDLIMGAAEEDSAKSDEDDAPASA